MNGNRPDVPCPRCNSDRVHKIGQDRITRRKQAGDSTPPLREVDHIYICEPCGHSWKHALPD